MKKYLIAFKSGNKVKVPEEFVEAINERIIGIEGARQFQCNTILDGNKTRFVIINLLEVDYIASSEDLI